MNAPFVEHNETKGADVLFHPAYQVGFTVVETDDRTRDNIQYQIVKNLQSTGRRAEAKYVVSSLLNSRYRHVSGAKLRHLALIELAKEDGLNFGEFRAVTDSILIRPMGCGRRHRWNCHSTICARLLGSKSHDRLETRRTNLCRQYPLSY